MPDFRFIGIYFLCFRKCSSQSVEYRILFSIYIFLKMMKCSKQPQKNEVKFIISVKLILALFVTRIL